ncbi:hypothetical protein PRIPAC_70300 [Pristionchus pacificus]|nr:hypothetical protein PRIPAC_70300 [Pristionchus pacificus]
MRAHIFLLSIAATLAARDKNLPDGGVRKTLTELQIHITVTGMVRCETDNTTFHIALMEHDDLSNDLIAETHVDIEAGLETYEVSGWTRIRPAFSAWLLNQLVLRNRTTVSE